MINLNSQNLSLLYSTAKTWLTSSERWEIKTCRKNIIFQTDISSSANGHGQLFDSYKTPLGRHYIRAKIGDHHKENAVFIRRRFTGEYFAPALKKKYPERDWILTRIMWLSGLEKGFNRLGNVDTMKRFIYIHGTPDSVEMGKTGSKGCIRMKNSDIVNLFGLIQVGTTVNLIL